jgi:hypothetical protein
MPALAIDVFKPSSPGFLNRILLLDAATGLSMGLLLCVGTVPLANALGLPPDVLMYAGLLLFGFAGVLGFAGLQPKPSVVLVWLVILGNLAWVVASVLVATVWYSPTALGQAFVAVQAITVLVLTALEWRGLNPW